LSIHPLDDIKGLSGAESKKSGELHDKGRRAAEASLRKELKQIRQREGQLEARWRCGGVVLDASGRRGPGRRMTIGEAPHDGARQVWGGDNATESHRRRERHIEQCLGNEELERCRRSTTRLGQHGKQLLATVSQGGGT
jgi:hypothetical protein